MSRGKSIELAFKVAEELQESLPVKCQARFFLEYCSIDNREFKRGIEDTKSSEIFKKILSYQEL